MRWRTDEDKQKGGEGGEGVILRTYSTTREERNVVNDASKGPHPSSLNYSKDHSIDC